MRVVPLAISAALIAAHFFRAGNFVLVAIALAAPFLLMTKRRWSAVVLQIALFVAGAEWIRTAVAIGRPRAVLILAAVALFTVLSAIPLSRLDLQ